jgi:SAM-dependent methyltransferase
MPFDDGVFDVAWMQNVGMNIADKQAFYSEVSRVLKPGGRFAFQELLAGNANTAYYPLPWATVPADNCLIAAEDLHVMLAETGFELEFFEDASESQLVPAPANTPPGISEAPQLSLSAYVEDLALKAQNAQRSLAEGQVCFVRAVYRRQ